MQIADAPANKSRVLIAGLTVFAASFGAYLMFKAMDSELVLAFCSFAMLAGLAAALVGFFLLMLANLKADKQKNQAAGKPRSRKTVFLYGLALMLAGFIINTTFLKLGIVGYLRELTRLATILGVALLLVGIFQLGMNLLKRGASNRK